MSAMGNEAARLLAINPEQESARIERRMREILRDDLKRRGFIIALSGGIDSSVCAALAVRAVGSKKVFGLMLPETDSSPESLSRAKLIADQFSIEYQVHDIAPALEAIGCYRTRDDAIRRLFSEYTAEWKNKIKIAGGTQGQFNHFELVVQSPDGRVMEQRLRLNEYLEIVAATNYKQRIRKTIEYFHADRLNYAVIGTPNRLEYDQGFFVKNGDGSADIKPIAHLYKTQVYALGRHFGLPDEICNAQPTTDTYSLAQGQDEFYFALPYQQMDVALWALNNGRSAEDAAALLGIDPAATALVYDDIHKKRGTTAYLHRPPVLVDAEA